MSTLADLRRENLKQMNDPAATADAVVPEETAEPEAATLPPASVLTETRTPVSTQPRKDGSTQVRKEARKSASTAVRNNASTAVDTASADPLLEAVREALAKKTVHPVGVKTTVEMPAELSKRAKRYALDHDNVPVRQVFLELMIAFLEKEGY